MKRFVWIACLAAALLASPRPVPAQDQPTSEPRADRPTVPAIPETVSRASVAVDGRSLAYVATAGTLPVVDAAGHAQAQIFFVAYEREGGDATRRPITFVFNGGPGAASAYLHMGALGPRRVVFADDGSVPPGPAAVVANAETWLPFTDLVFVDPVGTGYSVVPERARGERGERERDGGRYWGVNEDIEALGRFIRLYLTRKDRWVSPKFLAGESYGGFRVGRLADHLQVVPGIEIDGVILISPVIEFALHDGDAYRVLPWLMRVPAFAATARHHGKARFGGDRPMGEALGEVERFVLADLLPALAQGEALAEPARTALLDRLAGYTGLSVDMVRRLGGRVQRSEFVTEILRDRGRRVSLYDGAIADIDPDPADRGLLRSDPYLNRMSAALVAGFNAHAKGELGVKTDIPYLILNGEVGNAWNWRSGRGDRQQGFVGSADALKLALSRNPRLGLWVVHGWFDIITPYFASSYVVSQMALAPEVRRNVVLTNYHGGHMFYTHTASRVAFTREAAAFYRRTLGDARQ